MISNSHAQEAWEDCVLHANSQYDLNHHAHALPAHYHEKDFDEQYAHHDAAHDAPAYDDEKTHAQPSLEEVSPSSHDL